MTMRLFRSASARRSSWTSIAQDRSTWWALEAGIASDSEQVDELRAGHLVGRLWPNASPGAIYLASDLAVWAMLLRSRVSDPAFPVDAVGPWSTRLVDAFVRAEVRSDDPFARSLVELRGRWSAVCDPARLPAAAVELGRWLEALATEARWDRGQSAPELARAVENRAMSSALPLLLTATPSALAPPLGLRDTTLTRALIRSASGIAAWSGDLAEATLACDASPPNLVAWLAAADQLDFDDSLRRAAARHDGCVLAFAEAADAARRTGDADQVWLAHTLVDFVDAWTGWNEVRHVAAAPTWRPSPFRPAVDRIAS